MTSIIVVDASLLGPLIIEDERPDLVYDVVDALREGRALVPQHWWLEVANMARMAVRKQRLADDELDATFADLRALPVTVDPQTNRFAWSVSLDLSRRHDLTAYDAAYLELALRKRASLATRDTRLREAAAAEGVDLIPA